ncbi:MAG TPA: class I SAM-dependent methyltransferase [Streptosporangiaceae bacterium]|nr:class I SAM-dependent methyltransferase [Streptosporangiaceae bacterium]
MTAEARFAALLSAQGAELLAIVGEQPVTSDTALRLGSRLRARYPADLVAAALAQQELRVAARAKFSRAMDMFFTRAGLEQASSEVVARHRRERYAGVSALADLCCGIGGDLIALADGHQVRAVDADALHLRMALANAAAYQVSQNVRTEQDDVRNVSLAGLDAVFIDPARRTDRRRLRPGDSEPPLDWCLSLAGRVGRVGIKAAPGLSREAVPPGWELEFIAVGRDLKEAVAWSPALARSATKATILPGGHSLTPQPGPPVRVAPPGEFLLDPNPAVTRAGLVAELARAVRAWQIDPRIAFLCADTAVRTPFARTLRVIDSAPWNHKQLPARLRGLDIGAVDIRRRGLAGDVDQLRRHLKLSGSRRATLVMTRVQDRPWGLVCLDIPG